MRAEGCTFGSLRVRQEFLFGGLLDPFSLLPTCRPKQEDAPAHSMVLSEANAERLANALCRMRGAALKLGQMLVGVHGPLAL